MYGSPLVAAIRSGKEDLIKIILQACANVDMQCIGGMYASALVAAIDGPNPREKRVGFIRRDISTITETLLDHGAGVDYNWKMAVIEILLDAALNTVDEGTIRTILVAGGDVRNASNRIDITCHCELPQIPLNDRHELDDFNVPTLTKKDEGVLLSTCAEYLERSYGKQGIKILDSMVRALKDPSRVYGKCSAVCMVLN